MQLAHIQKVVPDKIECPKGCSDMVEIFPGEKVKVPVMAILNPNVYHFINTKEPYMLRYCPKCGRHWLIVI